MDDGARTIFLSTEGKNEKEVPKELVDFLKYVGAPLSESEKDYEDEFIQQLQESIKEVKKSREMGARYMTFQELLSEERAEGKAEGRVEGEHNKLVTQVQKKLAKGQTVEEIAEALEETVESIQEIVDGLQ